MPDNKGRSDNAFAVSSERKIAYVVLILVIRFLSTIGILTSHQAALKDIAPPSLVGGILGLAGASAWPVSMLVPVLTRTQDNPSVYVVATSFVALVSMIFFRETTRGLEMNTT